MRAVMAMLTDTSSDRVLVVGDPSLAMEIGRRFSQKTVQCGTRPLVGWTVVLADYGPPSLWERLRRKLGSAEPDFHTARGVGCRCSNTPLVPH